MVEGNTPLALYQEISRSQPQLSHLNVFDEYVGVPKEEPRNCADLSRRNMIEPRGNPEAQYHQVCSLKAEAGRSIRQHEMTIRLAGGLDVLVLGKNAHIGFNEPGSDADLIGRVLPLRRHRSMPTESGSVTSTRLTWGCNRDEDTSRSEDHSVARLRSRQVHSGGSDVGRSANARLPCVLPSGPSRYAHLYRHSRGGMSTAWPGSPRSR